MTCCQRSTPTLWRKGVDWLPFERVRGDLAAELGVDEGVGGEGVRGEGVRGEGVRGEGSGDDGSEGDGVILGFDFVTAEEDDYREAVKEVMKRGAKAEIVLEWLERWEQARKKAWIKRKSLLPSRLLSGELCFDPSGQL